jgi:hypothetical protein
MSYCCKGGKHAVLQPTARYATTPGTSVSEAAVFLDTLVCNVGPHARLLQMPDPLPMGGGAGRVVTAAVHPGGPSGGGVRVAWKQDECDGMLPPREMAGGH